MAKHTNPVWKATKAELERLIEKCDSLGEVMAHFGMKNNGGNFNTMVRRLTADNIDYAKFKANYGKGTLKPYRPLSTVLVKGSTFNQQHLAKRLVKEGVIENKCGLCGQKPTWKGKPLRLALNQINGVKDDLRLVNLRLLCPNCASQS